MSVAIVTGGNSGIGRAAAVALAERGFELGITWHRDEERAEEATREVREAGVRCELRHLDLQDPGSGPRAVDELTQALGGVDVLVNNAGYGSSKPCLEITAAVRACVFLRAGIGRWDGWHGASRG